MTQSEQDNSGVRVPPPLVYVLVLAVGLALHFVFPVNYMPLGWVQLAVGLPLGASAVLQHANEKVQQRRGVAAKERLECCPVTGLEGEHELRVFVVHPGAPLPAGNWNRPAAPKLRPGSRRLAPPRAATDKPSDY